MQQIDHSQIKSTFELDSFCRQSAISSMENAEDEQITIHISTRNWNTLINKLINEICSQKKLLKDRTTNINELIEKTQVNETNKKQAETVNNVYLNRLRNLKHLHSLNKSKIFELERGTNEFLLKEEIKLNELLKKELLNYKLKLEETLFELKLKKDLVIDLQIRYKQLESVQQQNDYEKIHVEKHIIDLKKETLLNQSKLNYLIVNSENFDKYIKNRKIELEMLANQLEE
jgi:hypothetical protein